MNDTPKSNIEIESDDPVFWKDLIDWLVHRKYASHVTIRVKTADESPLVNVFTFMAANDARVTIPQRISPASVRQIQAQVNQVTAELNQ